jgi:hypothetical protein
MNPSDKYEQIKDIKRLNPVELEAMVLNHAQQIKDIATHLLELKRLVTPMVEFKPEKSLPEPVAWLHWLTVDGERFPQLTLMPRTDKDEPLYTSPKHTWVGLMKNEKLYSNTNYLGKSAEAWHSGVEWAEAKIKEKNGG